MKKRRLIIISSVVAAVIIIMAVVGVTVFADTPTPTAGTSTNPQSVLMSKVAGILGIDQSTLEAAFTQAKTEMRSEAEAAKLAQMVADGKITQEQADQYKAWLDSRPDVPALGPAGIQGFRGGKIGRGFGGFCPRGNFPSTTDSTTTN